MEGHTEVLRNNRTILDTTSEVEKTSLKQKLQKFRAIHQKVINYVLFGIFNILALLYLIIASNTEYNNYCNNDNCREKWCRRFGILVIIYTFYYMCCFYCLLYKPFIKGYLFKLGKKLMDKYGKWIKIIFLGFFVSTKVLLVIYMLISELSDDYTRLQSLIGIPVIILIALFFSNNLSKVNQKPVVRGLFLQLIIGLVVLKQPNIRNVFYCISNRFLAFRLLSLNGSKFVFGNLLLEQEQTFGFYALTSVFFVSFVIGIFYHLGWIQNYISKIGQFAKYLTLTAYIESTFSIVRLHFGVMESFLFVQPFLSRLTKSELHCILTSAFASSAISSVSLYISLGAQPIHLITANIMSSFAALGLSKLIYPETEEKRIGSGFIKSYKQESDSLIDAGTRGISNSIKIYLNVIANVIAFIAVVSFFNSALEFFGDFLLLDFKLEYILAYIFTPICWLIGIPWNDAGNISEVIGIKFVNNEFVAYKKLMEMLQNDIVAPRSASIATFVLSSFTNPISVAIVVGTFVALAPDNRKVMMNLLLSAFFTAIGTSLMTASVAGFLMNSDMYNFTENVTNSFNGTRLNIHYI